MMAKNVRCNEFYWSKRYAQKCRAIAIARYLINLEFSDSRNNGWYHCQEIEEIPDIQKKVIDITSLVK